MKALAIIPARGGSKRIPRKNIREFRGKPIIAWSIEAALSSGLFETVMVSTDDPEIAETARAWGAETPFLRSAENSNDHAILAEVLREVVANYVERNTHFSHACCLYATAPFVRVEHLAEGLSLLKSRSFSSVISVTPFDYPIWRSFCMSNEEKVAYNFPNYRDKRSQDIPPAYQDAGQWCWFDVKRLMKGGSLIGDNTGAVILPRSQVQDIDDEEDWQIAELKHQIAFGER